jgi:hypothetical protein
MIKKFDQSDQPLQSPSSTKQKTDSNDKK